MTITTRDILQSFLTAIKNSPIPPISAWYLREALEITTNNSSSIFFDTVKVLSKVRKFYFSQYNCMTEKIVYFTCTFENQSEKFVSKVKITRVIEVAWLTLSLTWEEQRPWRSAITLHINSNQVDLSGKLLVFSGFFK